MQTLYKLNVIIIVIIIMYFNILAHVSCCRSKSSSMTPGSYSRGSNPVSSSSWSNFKSTNILCYCIYI